MLTSKSMKALVAVRYELRPTNLYPENENYSRLMFIQRAVEMVLLNQSFFTFDESRILIADSSSKMLPSDEERVSRILSSISFSCFLFDALWTINACLSSSNSGLKWSEIKIYCFCKQYYLYHMNERLFLVKLLISQGL